MLEQPIQPYQFPEIQPTVEIEASESFSFKAAERIFPLEKLAVVQAQRELKKLFSSDTPERPLTPEQRDLADITATGLSLAQLRHNKLSGQIVQTLEEEAKLAD